MLINAAALLAVAFSAAAAAMGLNRMGLIGFGAPYTPCIGLQCGNGHVLCEQCLANVAACPTCKLPLSAPVRNLALEHIVDAVRVTCSHRAGGCSARLRAYELEEHMLQACDHRPVPCPACGAQVWPQELGRHLLREHAACCAEGSPNGGFFAGSIARIDFIVFGYSINLGQQLLHLDRSLDHLIVAYLSTTKSPNKLEDHTYTLSIQSNTAASTIGLASEPAGPLKPALKLSMEGALLHSLRADTQVRHARGVLLFPDLPCFTQSMDIWAQSVCCLPPQDADLSQG